MLKFENEMSKKKLDVVFLSLRILLYSRDLRFKTNFIIWYSKIQPYYVSSIIFILKLNVIVFAPDWGPPRLYTIPLLAGSVFL
jgi:hypothetical protein